MAAFARLQALGDEQFGKILNLLTRGEPIRRVARMIQQNPPQGWGLFQDIAEGSLVQQLQRLRNDIKEGQFGKHTAKKIKEGMITTETVIKKLEGVSGSVLVRMEELSNLQRNRVLALVEKEKESLLPMVMSGKMAPQEYRHILTQTNMVFNDYKQLLIDLQEIRFKLGLDEWRGPVTTNTVRGASVTTNLPDGTSVQKQVFEAVSMVEEIFAARKIPQAAER